MSTRQAPSSREALVFAEEPALKTLAPLIVCWSLFFLFALFIPSVAMFGLLFCR